MKFAKKCLKLSNMKHLFPAKRKEHTMYTRNIMKYEVNKSKSQRYKFSAIPQMQKALNTEYVMNMKRRQECFKQRV